MLNQSTATNITNVTLLSKDFQYLNNQLANNVLVLCKEGESIVK